MQDENGSAKGEFTYNVITEGGRGVWKCPEMIAPLYFYIGKQTHFDDDRGGGENPENMITYTLFWKGLKTQKITQAPSPDFLNRIQCQD